jgi:type III pantothenate kinase
MLLTIDIGNTNLTLGLFQRQSLGPHWRLATDHQRMADEYGLQMLGLLEHARIPVSAISAVCLASVVPQLTGRVIQACELYLNHKPFIISADIHTGVSILYDNPSSVGVDRIADAAAVMALYGGPACVVDFGTATTFNAITVAGEYLGGAITPGLNIAADALFHHTAKLPRVDLDAPPSVIGRNTVHAMQSGLLFGYVALVEGMIARFKAELGPGTRVIATGGLSEIIAQHTASIDILDPWLTLHGLRILWELNHPPA